MVVPYVPERGDVVMINFDPQQGREQAGRRPAVVLSPGSYNAKVGLAILCPITNQKKGYVFEVEIPPGQLVTGVILSDQVKSMDWAKRNVQKKCVLDNEVLEDVLAMVYALIDPDEN
jgi:mRNA interferase MazF